MKRDTFERTLTRSDSTLKRRVCGLCDQTLYQAKRGNCSAIWEGDHCKWVPAFKALKKEAK